MADKTVAASPDCASFFGDGKWNGLVWSILKADFERNLAISGRVRASASTFFNAKARRSAKAQRGRKKNRGGRRETQRLWRFRDGFECRLQSFRRKGAKE